jgi:putative exporter of polyketide antibiotics
MSIFLVTRHARREDSEARLVRSGVVGRHAPCRRRRRGRRLNLVVGVLCAIAFVALDYPR